MSEDDKSFKIESLPEVDFYTIKKAAMVFRAINHTLRQHLLKIIDKNEPITVTQLYIKLRLEQSVASQHLAMLRQVGIVSMRHAGKFRYYSLNKSRIEEITQLATNIVNW